MLNKVLALSILIFSIITTIIIYGVVNGAGCSYELDNVKTSVNTDTFLTCYRGKIVALHYQREGVPPTSFSTWKVEGRQLVFGKQVIYFVYDRNKISGGDDDNENDRYNRLSQGYKMLFYHFEISNGKAYIFQTFPKRNLVIGDIGGRISFFRK